MFKGPQEIVRDNKIRVIRCSSYRELTLSKLSKFLFTTNRNSITLKFRIPKIYNFQLITEKYKRIRRTNDSK